MRLKSILLPTALLFAALHFCTANAESVEISGSTTVNAMLIEPNKAEIENKAGVTLNVHPSNSGSGLTDLFGRNADVAMISAPFADVADQVYKVGPPKGLRLHEGDFNVVTLGRAQVLFIVDMGNHVEKLTKQQLAGLLTGKIKNWKEVGGGNVPVTLVAELPNGAMRTEITRKVLDGKDFPASTMAVERAPAAMEAVASTNGALGFMSSAMTTKQRMDVRVIPTEVQLDQTLSIATFGQPDEKSAKVIAAIKEVALETLSR